MVCRLLHLALLWRPSRSGHWRPQLWDRPYTAARAHRLPTVWFLRHFRATCILDIWLHGGWSDRVKVGRWICDREVVSSTPGLNAMKCLSKPFRYSIKTKAWGSSHLFYFLQTSKVDIVFLSFQSGLNKWSTGLFCWGWGRALLPVSGGRWHSVIFYDRWSSVALRWVFHEKLSLYRLSPCGCKYAGI